MSNKKDKDLSKLTKELDECKLMIKKLQENEKNIYSMIDASSDSIYSISRDYRYLFINNEVKSRLGLSREQVLGKTFSDLYSPGESAELVKIIDRVFKTGKSIKKEHMSKRLNKWYFRTVNPVKNHETGKVISAVVVSKDITELKKTEEDLKKTYQELKESTALLLHTERMSALGELTAGVAHECNQPLTGIYFAVANIKRLTEKGLLTEKEIKESIEDVDTNAQRMSRIINHIRTFARQDTLKSVAMNVNDSINGALNLLGEQLRLHNIKVIKKIDPDLPLIKGEPYQIEQVIINIISNARDALDEKSTWGKNKLKDWSMKIIIGSKLLKNHENNECVCVYVSDNGTGLVPEVKQKMFEPFFTTKEVGKATGLGLSISYGIIQSHKGKIDVETRKGEGTTVSIKFPIKMKGK